MEYKINNLSDLDSVLEISKEIFNPSKEEVEEFYNKEDWINKINSDGLLITTYVENNLAGFTLCYIKEKDSLHLWVGGVLEKYRGLGLWSEMYRRIEKYAKERKYIRLTLNTFKDRFPVMYKFANKHGFKCYKIEIKDALEKSFFEKNISKLFTN